MRFHALVASVSMLAASLSAHAATFFLSSSSGGTYSYSLNDPYLGKETFDQGGDSIALTGLYGVTGATSNNPYFTIAYTATSVTWTNDNSYGYVFACLNPSCVYNLFDVTSTSTTFGPVVYNILANPAQAGVVDGPAAPTVIAATPEPSSLALLGTGVLCGIGAVRRRLYS